VVNSNLADLTVLTHRVATGRRVTVEHLTTDRLAWLYASSIAGELLQRWRLFGRTPSLEQFMMNLFRDSYCQLVIVGLGDGSPVGLAQLYGVDFRSGHAFFSLFLEAESIGTGWPLEGAALAIDWIADRFALRRLYFEIPTFNLQALGRTVERFSDSVFVLRRHRYYAHEYHDVHVRCFDLAGWSHDWIATLTSPKVW
jgi:RimJ/RimL family protein N-acetyltransferase